MAENDSRFGSEDNREARQHMRNTEENRDALADQARRVEASAPDDTSRPVEGHRAAGFGGEDTTRAAENQRNVRENLDELRAQGRRVDASTPDDIDRTGPRNG